MSAAADETALHSNGEAQVRAARMTEWKMDFVLFVMINYVFNTGRVWGITHYQLLRLIAH